MLQADGDSPSFRGFFFGSVVLHTFWRELSNGTPSMMGSLEEIMVSVVSGSLVMVVREIAAWQMQDYLD